ncbi:MAG: hypothetical protein K2Y37_23215 [Pirellulales bacterium]|nr:hypothetical protein [Pirellulales bacterium]
MLDREEYIEQAYFFRALADRMLQNLPTQELLGSVRDELLSTTKLPLAVDFMASELRVQGVFGTAMAKLPHYFTSFQAFVVSEAEDEQGRFDIWIAVQILEREARYRAESPPAQGLFFYQFETLCRNRLGYDAGLTAMAADPAYDQLWREWLLTLRRQIGLVDLADLVYVRSQQYVKQQQQHQGPGYEIEAPPLFGEKEGRIALANRHKDPLLLFAALERHLEYPAVPRPKRPDETHQLLPQLARRVERLETRLKLLEEERKGGIDLSRFFGQQPPDEGK